MLASCRLFQSDGTCLMVPSNLEHHVSSSQPRPEVGFYYTPMHWALTFPNLRRHHEKICLTALPLRGSLRYLLLRSGARSFHKRGVVRLTAFNLHQSVGPIGLLASFHRESINVYECGFHATFCSAVLQTGPLTLCAVF